MKKLTFKLFLTIAIFFLSVSCAFDGDISFNEIKINDWFEITYIVNRKGDSNDFNTFELYRTDRKLKINRRYDIDDYEYENRILQSSRKIIYNNDFVLADDGHLGDDTIYDSGSKYFKIVPFGNRGGGQSLPFSAKEITRQEFDSIGRVCKDCKTVDLKLLRGFIASGSDELKPKSN